MILPNDIISEVDDCKGIPEGKKRPLYEWIQEPLWSVSHSSYSTLLRNVWLLLWPSTDIRNKTSRSPNSRTCDIIQLSTWVLRIIPLLTETLWCTRRTSSVTWDQRNPTCTRTWCFILLFNETDSGPPWTPNKIGCLVNLFSFRFLSSVFDLTLTVHKWRHHPTGFLFNLQ